MRTPRAAEWFRRHNLLFARDGMAYPDLSIMRVDDQVGIVWNSDPADATLPGRFLDSGAAVASRPAAEAELRRVVEAVLERTRTVADDPLVDELRADWDAVRQSMTDEPLLCSRLGMLGLDPYAPDLSEALEKHVEELDSSLSPLLVGDILAASTGETLPQNVRAVHTMLEKLDSEDSERLHPESPAVVPDRPYAVGFARARWLRHRLGLSPDAPVQDMDRVVSAALGSTFHLHQGDPVEADVEGVVQANGAVGALLAERGDARSERFHTARIIHHALFATTPAHPTRLLTRSHDWQQSASRSFAAELLAPAAGLEARLGDRVDWGADDTDLARAFDVSPLVIRHQLTNHGLE
ncbi:MAG: ImmA/IrrE family metallo-endopeptidase [Myxococcota bacterium]